MRVVLSYCDALTLLMCSAVPVLSSLVKVPSTTPDEACRSACRRGHLDLLKYIVRRVGNRVLTIELTTWAARGGHLHILEWLRSVKVPWTQLTCESAARGGHLDLLKVLRSHGTELGLDICQSAARSGNLTLLQWCVDQGCELDDYSFSAAARGGHLHVMKWIESRGVTYYPHRIAEPAIKGGNIEVLNWLDGRVKWNRWVLTCALDNSTDEVVRWLLSRSTDVDTRVLVSMFRRCNTNAELVSMLDLVPTRTLSDAAAIASSNNNSEVVRWCASKGAVLDGRVMESFVSHANYEMIRWCRSRGAPLTEQVVTSLMFQSATEEMEWAVTEGFFLTPRLYWQVIHRERIDLVQWLRSKGVLWRGDSCAQVASTGNVELMEFALNNGMVWDASAAFEAATGNHIDMLKYLSEVRGGFSREVRHELRSYARSTGKTELVRYLDSLDG